MTTLQAWVGDGLVPADQAGVSVYDRAFRGGEGVFETMRAYGSRVFRLDSHLDRALHGAAVLGFAPPERAAIAAAVEATVVANRDAIGGDGAAVRLTITPGAIDPWSPFPGDPDGVAVVVVTGHRLRDQRRTWDEGVRAATVPWGREVPHVKAVSYVASSLARRHARDHGADEALFTDSAGDVLEASTSNVFAVLGRELVTPPTGAGLLPGVTRAAVLEVAERAGLVALQRPLPLSELLAADEAFLTASTREVVPLVHVDGRDIGAGLPGPATRRVHAAYRDLVALETGQ